MPLLLLLVQQPAGAFFCFSFSGHSGQGDAFAYPVWQPPPPLWATTYSPLYGDPDRDGSELPAIKPAKKSPDVIQGYRFRPLDDSAPSPLRPVAPKDWRN